jgi:ubiquitin-protein ligase
MIRKREFIAGKSWQLLAFVVVSTMALASPLEHAALSVPSLGNQLKVSTNSTSLLQKKKRKKSLKNSKGSATQSNTTEPSLLHLRSTAKKTILLSTEDHRSTALSSSSTIQEIANPKTSSIPAKSNAVGGSRESAALRRIQREWRDAAKLGIAYDWLNHKSVGKVTSTQYVRIGPFGKHLLRWHFSVSGPPSSDFANGIYHGRVLLPKDYPGSPPRIQVLTPSGRFLPGQDICLSASSFHPESWTPRWTVLSLVDALRLHMLTQANEIGGMNSTPQERRAYAKASRSWALGRVQHSTMIEAGLFPMEVGEAVDTDIDDEYSRSTTIADNMHHEPEGLITQPTVRQTHEAAVVGKQQFPRHAGVVAQLVNAIYEVLRSPPRLAVLLLLTVFLLLNK